MDIQQVSQEMKQRVISAMLNQRKNFAGSDAKFALSLGIHKSAFAQLKSGKTDRILSDSKFISLARRLNLQTVHELGWKTAKTAVFVYITEQLEICQSEIACGIFCDRADIGKSYAAKWYARNHRNAAYIDCSLVKSKQKLVRQIAKEFGVDHTGKYADVFEDLTYYLNTISNPIIILDEAGDLDYSAFLELKALWNATEGYCAWYMMGADGLRKKIDRGIGYRKVGFTEIFRRYGKCYHKVLPPGDAGKQLVREMCAMVIKANLPNEKDIQGLLVKAKNSLTRIDTMFKMQKRRQKAA